MAQYDKNSKSVRYAGFSVHGGEGSQKEVHFHTSGSKEKFIVWANLVGSVTTADYRMFKLPSVMSKVAALEYLLRKNLEKVVRAALTTKLENFQDAPVTGVARKGRSTARRQRDRRGATGARKTGRRATSSRKAA